MKENMKLIIESPVIMEGHYEETINEAKQTEVNYYLTGLLSTPGEKNRNGRVYPMYIWEREVKKYQAEIENKTINTLGEWMHPSYSHIDVMASVMRITEMYIKDNKVYCKCKILNDNTDATNKLKALIKEGMKIGISTRGLGKVSSTGVVEEYTLITADLVDIPSNFNSELTGVVEGGSLNGLQIENGIVQGKEYIIDEQGCIGEACNLEQVQNLEDYPVLSKLLDILKTNDASILCDLDVEAKEKVLLELVDSFKEPEVPEELKELKELPKETPLLTNEQALDLIEALKAYK